MKRRLFLHATAAGLFSRTALAQNPVIAMVVPFAPGGIADVTARPFARTFSRHIQRPTIVDNRPGAGGALGIAHVARQRGNPNTLLMALSSIVTIPISDRATGKVVSYQRANLTPIGRISAEPTVLAVRSDSPIRTIHDLAAQARQYPGQLSFSSSGLFGTTHIAQAMLWQTLNLEMLHVPYSGGAPSMRALLAGEVDLTAQGPAVLLPHVEAGSVRLLGHWGVDRLDIYPELPAFKAQGIDVEFAIWAGVFAPMGLSETQYTAYRQATQDTVHDPAFIQNMQAIKTPIKYLDAPEFASFIAQEDQRMHTVITRIANASEGNLR